MTIYYVGGAEAFVSTTAGVTVTVDPLFFVGTGGSRNSAWASRDHDYAFAGEVNANNETAYTELTTGVAVVADWYGSGKMSFPAAALAPAAPLKMFVIAFSGGGGITGPYTIRIQDGAGGTTLGDWGLYELVSGVETLRATWASPGLSADTPYWFLLVLDSTNNRLAMWVAQEHPARRGVLKQPTDWSGAAKIDYTHASDITFGSSIKWGPQNYKLTNANSGAVLWDSLVSQSDKPVRPRMVALAELTGDGYYSAAGGAGATPWLASGGGQATYTEVDDPIASAADNDTTYIVTNQGTAGPVTERYSAAHESSAAIGLVAADTIQAVIPLGRNRYVSGTIFGANAPRLFLRYNSTDELPPNQSGLASTSVWITAYGPYDTAPGSVAWSQAVFDATEWGLQYVDDTGKNHVQRYTWGGLYVVYQREVSLIRPSRSMQPLLVR